MPVNGNAPSRVRRFDLLDVVFFVGLASPPVGVGLWSIPAGLVVLGAECLGLWGFSVAVRMRGTPGGS